MPTYQFKFTEEAEKAILSLASTMTKEQKQMLQAVLEVVQNEVSAFTLEVAQKDFSEKREKIIGNNLRTLMS